MRIDWSIRALADLDRFAEFLHERDPRLAKRIAAEIRERAQILADHPLLGRQLGGREEYRQVILQVAGAPYIFQYRVEGERLVMLRVFHGRELRGERKPGT